MTNSTPGEFVAYITAAGLIPKPIRQLSEVNEKIMAQMKHLYAHPPETDFYDVSTKIEI